MKRRSTIAIIAITLILTLFSTAASAQLARSNFTWNQAPNPIYYTSTLEHNGVGQIIFEGVATSSSPGTFTIELQKKGSLGNWNTVSTTYTGRAQSSRQTYNVRTGNPVLGEYHRIYWPPQGSGTFRFRLSSASKPQSTTFSQVRF